MQKPKLGKIKLLSAKEQVAAVLRKAILSRDLVEGQEITLEGIARLVGVSSMPVREAFHILAADGLIQVRPNKGAVYMTYQWWIGACNELVSENLSPITKTPEYKYSAVNVERIADQRAAEQYVIDEYNKLKSRLRESAMG